MDHKECTPWVKRLQINNVELLKKKLKSYGIDPFGARKAIDIATGNKLWEKVVENLIRTQNWR